MDVSGMPGAQRTAIPLWPRLRSVLGRSLDLALPPLCPSCRELVAAHAALCANCWSKLSFITRPYCERLGIPFAYDAGPGLLSLEAIADPPAYGKARAAVRFDDISRSLIHAFKYGDHVDLAPMLGGWMVAAGADVLADADALVPVPLHWRRLWARRFNQSAALAGAIGRATGIEVCYDALRRARATPQQVGLTQAERLRNVQGAFKVPQAGRIHIAGRRLVLVDDVLTSGSTVEACSKALLRAGAANVDVLVFARVVQAVRAPI
jgi:ComF family protein